MELWLKRKKNIKSLSNFWTYYLIFSLYKKWKKLLYIYFEYMYNCFLSSIIFMHHCLIRDTCEEIEVSMVSDASSMRAYFCALNAVSIL